MKKNLAKKITMSILAGAMLMSSSVVWADSPIINTASVTSAIEIGSVSGDSQTASGDSSVAIGNKAGATKAYAVAIGFEAQATGNQAVAIGLQAEAKGGSSVAIGLQAKANGGSSVAIGDGAIADADNVVSVGNGGASGAGGPNYRKIINVNDGTDEHDAVTVGQLNKKADKATTLAGYGINDAYTKTEADNAITNAVSGKADKATTLAGYGITDAYTKTEIDGMMLGGSSDAIAGINQRLDKTNAKINKVGAGAAALAALHPLEYDPDDKLTFSAGMGNYAGENAAALGAFYRPNEKFMLSLGGTMGNGENMVNLGLSIGLDKPNGYAKLSKRELIQKVNAMEAKYEAVEAENEAMKDQLANADERISKLEALVAQLVKK